MTLLDLFGAQMCIEGVLAGLALRHLDGRGRRVDSSLLGAADVLLAEAVGPDALGSDTGRTQPIVGVFDTADEPLALAARSVTSIDALCRAVGIAAPPPWRPTWSPRPPGAAAAQAGGPVLAGAPATSAGVPAAVVHTDLTVLPVDPRLAGHIAHHGCAVVTSPWRF